jgi:hypothetical protein
MFHSTNDKMTQKEIQDILNNFDEFVENNLSDEALEQRHNARANKDKEKTRQHFKALGDACVRTGRIVEVSRKGGQTVTEKKLETIRRTAKERRQFSDEQILEMKELYKNDISIGFGDLAEQYGCSIAQISFIMNGEQYGDVGEKIEIRQPLFKCPHCDKPHMTKSNYKRFHGDKCKSKPQNS